MYYYAIHYKLRKLDLTTVCLLCKIIVNAHLLDNDKEKITKQEKAKKKADKKKTKAATKKKNASKKDGDADDAMTSSDSDSDDDVDNEIDDRSIVQGKTQQELIHEENKKTSKKSGFEIAPANHGTYCFIALKLFLAFSVVSLTISLMSQNNNIRLII